MKKSLRKLLLGTILVGTLFALAGCGGKKKEVSVDTASLAKQLVDETVTTDSLTQTQDSMLSTIYALPEGSAGTAYMSSGATACEVAVIQSADSSKTGDVETIFKNRVKSQSDLYASYNAEQVTKLDSAIIKSAGAYTVLVVCDDTDKANDILKNAGF